jgi:hypothetical protein
MIFGFLIRALDEFATKKMVPFLANNKQFQNFVVRTNETVKQMQNSAVETVQNKGLSFFFFWR